MFPVHVKTIIISMTMFYYVNLPDQRARFTNNFCPASFEKKVYKEQIFQWLQNITYLL